MPGETSTGRREYDTQGGALVVPLREYLEDKIEAVRESLHAEIHHVRADVSNVGAQATREHAEVQKEISALRVAVESVSAASAEQRITASTLLRATAAAGGVVTFIAGVAAAAVAVFG